MKTLTLVRHAKSSWDNALVDDFDRPLNKRGSDDAPRSAKKFAELLSGDDTLYIGTSSAKRASETAGIFAEVLGVDRSSVVLMDDLYLASIQAIRSIIQTKIPEEIEHAILFGHNPTFEWLVQELSSKAPPHPMVTCAIATIRFDDEFWGSVGDQPGELLHYLWPKMDDAS